MLKAFRRHTISLTDEELVASYQSGGDAEQLGILYERYVELVFGVCLKYLKDRSLAEDAVMAIFEVLMEKVKTQDIRQFRPWLHVVAKNHCLMQLRKKNILVPFDGDNMHSGEAVHPVDDFEPDAEEEALRRCLEKLNEQQRLCVQQFYFEDKSYKEIAGQTGEEVGMVRSNIQNGRRNLRLCMEKKAIRRE